MSKIIEFENVSGITSLKDNIIDYDHMTNEIKKFRYEYNPKTKILKLYLEEPTKEERALYIVKKIKMFQTNLIKRASAEFYSKCPRKYYNNNLIGGFYFVANMMLWFSLNKKTCRYVYHPCPSIDCISAFLPMHDALTFTYIKEHGYKI